MLKMKILVTVLVSGMFFSTVSGQVITRPNYSLKSHETLEILKVEVTAREVRFQMSVENRISGGNFCADKNIFIIYPDGTRSKLRSSEKIPVCPDTHQFMSIGEKLSFTLIFPPLRQGTEWIDLMEECSENCFSFYGITLDTDLNQRINEAFSFAEKGEPARAQAMFIKIIEETDYRNLGSESLLYLSIIKLAKEVGNTSTAEEWYKRFKLSGAPRSELYFRYLELQGIKF